MKIIDPSVELLFVTPNAEKLIEQAARTCYKSEDKITATSYKDFVNKICNVRKHESVMEHAHATFRFVCDRACANQLTRHRLIAVSQESTRYVDYSSEKNGSEIRVINPFSGYDSLGTEEGYCAEVDWEEAIKKIEDVYLRMVSNGVTKDVARSVLPLCTATELVVSANIREWRHIFKMRCDSHAHYQIRGIMNKAKSLLQSHFQSIKF